ncbi:MAG: hypothetical protein HKN94_17345 [Acidimicrobiales bacterium]|nr:hypothetical protein [Acidimicrobiales bacterium]RZV44655.1 MAG: hypothetical protein EX269_11390 [Acidimicrobiales bacterium]
MSRRNLSSLLLLLVLVASACASAERGVLVDSEDADDAALEDSADSGQDDDLRSGATTTTNAPAAPRETLPPRDPLPAVAVVGGVAQFNTGIPIPSLWLVEDVFSQEDEPGQLGMSFYRVSPDHPALAMAIGNSCGQHLVEISVEPTGGNDEIWKVDSVTASEFSCGTNLPSMFAQGQRFVVSEAAGSFFFVRGFDQPFSLYGQMFESFSDQGDPRANPGGAVAGRTP